MSSMYALHTTLPLFPSGIPWKGYQEHNPLEVSPLFPPHTPHNSLLPPPPPCEGRSCETTACLHEQWHKQHFPQLHSRHPHSCLGLGVWE